MMVYRLNLHNNIKVNRNFIGNLMTTPFSIEKAWGDSVENVTMDDIKTAIKETIDMDDEHGAFWIKHDDFENVLEVHKDLKLFYIYGDNPSDQLYVKLSSWDEIKKLYKYFLENNFEKIEREIKRIISEGA